MQCARHTDERVGAVGRKHQRGLGCGGQQLLVDGCERRRLDHVTSATGSGIGQVNYTVAANPGAAARTGTLIVAGQTVTFTQAANSCVFTVSPTSVAVHVLWSDSVTRVVVNLAR